MSPPLAFISLSEQLTDVPGLKFLETTSYCNTCVFSPGGSFVSLIINLLFWIKDVKAEFVSKNFFELVI